MPEQIRANDCDELTDSFASLRMAARVYPNRCASFIVTRDPYVEGKLSPRLYDQRLEQQRTGPALDVHAVAPQYVSPAPDEQGLEALRIGREIHRALQDDVGHLYARELIGPASRTGANDVRCTGQGPRTSSARRCSGVAYPALCPNP